MVKRYPHSIKIAYSTGGFVNGKFVPGTATEIVTECRIEPLEARNQLKDGQSGKTIDAEFEIYCPRFYGFNNVPEKAKVISNSNDNPVAFRSRDRTILRFSAFQKHISIKV